MSRIVAKDFFNVGIDINVGGGRAMVIFSEIVNALAKKEDYNSMITINKWGNCETSWMILVKLKSTFWNFTE